MLGLGSGSPWNCDLLGFRFRPWKFWALGLGSCRLREIWALVLERPRLGPWVAALPVDSETKGSQETVFHREEGLCAEVR